MPPLSVVSRLEEWTVHFSDEEKIEAILDHIKRGTHTERDIEVLREHLRFDSTHGTAQVGKYNVYIREGQEIFSFR